MQKSCFWQTRGLAPERADKTQTWQNKREKECEKMANNKHAQNKEQM
jgi:hypothetical protein